MILKTPLRYPGGKSRAMKYLGEKFPKKLEKYNEPFLGGGSVALWVTKEYPDAEIWVNDLYENLFLFWVSLQNDSARMTDYITSIKNDCGDDKDKGEELFKHFKSTINEQDNFVRGCWFYALNKMSFSGLGESSGFSHQALKSNFSTNGISKLPEYSKLISRWKITNLDWKELMNEDAFVFLDPPYEIKSGLYGKNGEHHIHFDHDEFAKVCNNCQSNQMITYNSDQKVIDRFPGWNKISWDLTYTMRSNSENYRNGQSDKKELLLTNYEEKNELEKLF